ncbi:HD domain-containing protein [Vicingus serpentipes]|uniref:HD domain-containing protein n=1 Tax=Vicingus serpentipes TaxID=1926625 RepID=A0A5C6RU70_9FLAO|nr:adenylate/guanylate cyclase domain-containing protein [Vicingus serpentipes]TXB65848.1 HD domain-containing protein [Vicingus serpentipes]
MSEIQDLISKNNDLIKTNQRLNEQIKSLILKNDELTVSVNELEKQLKKGKKNEDENNFKVKGITALFIEIQGHKDIIDDASSSESLYDKLDEIYIKFNEIAQKHKAERVKVIGDYYVCAGGIAEKNSTNSIDIALIALEISDYLNTIYQSYEEQGKAFWNLRIGIHSGNGIVNVKGQNNKSYTLTGEVINTLPRIASMSEPGEIYISDYTYELIKSYFNCDYVAELPAKYRGSLGLYKLKRIKKIYSEDRKVGIIPNRDFMLKYLMRQFTDIERKVLDFLQEKLPEHLHYHNYCHTIDVVNQTELIGIGEGVSDEHLLLLKTAALFHDSGHVIQSPNHEFYSTEIAREWLPKYGYLPNQIDTICEIIMATQLPPEPNNLLEMIICDSDLDYLGRADFIPGSNALFEELKAQNILSDLNEWNKLQVKFLSNHQFFTATSQRLREVNKQSQIERIEKLIV